MSENALLIEQCFRGLLETKHFRSITVKEICAQLGVSRKTFYAYFDSKEAIIDIAFRRDVLQPVLDLARLLTNDELLGLARSVFKHSFQAVYDDGAYYRSLVVPMRGNDFTFLDIATSAFYDLYSKMLERLKQPSTTRQAEYVASYFASAHASFLQKWVCDDFPIPTDQIDDMFVTISLPFWKSLAANAAV